MIRLNALLNQSPLLAYVGNELNDSEWRKRALPAVNLYLIAVAREPGRKFTCNLGGAPFLYHAFPDHSRPPSLSLKAQFGSVIALNIAFELGLPKLTIGCRISGKAATLVPVPETAVNLNRCPVTRKYEVWSSGQRSFVDPESKAEPVKSAPEGHFGLRVLRTNTRHHPRACRFVDNVDHFFSWNRANFLVSVRAGGRIVQWQARSML